MAKKKQPLVACVVVETHRHYEQTTHKEVREYRWSAGLSVRTLPFPLACVEGQSCHSDPKEALEKGLEFMERLSIKVISKAIPRVL